VARKQRVSPNARRTSVYLTTAQEHALATIEHERRHRKESGDSPSEIVADAIWLLGERYNVRRSEVEARFPEPVLEVLKGKVTTIRSSKKRH
jgi:hypothetical protein